jgi:hypothetical protein
MDPMKTRNCFVVVAALVAAPAAAHHGIGTFDTKREITISGAVTGIDFVNPHAYLYLDATGADGKVAAWKCEMRSATTLRRSGWSPEMFKRGTAVTITGAPDRNNPTSWYLTTIVFADGTSADRYGQLSQAPAPRPTAERAARLPSGEPNLAGDWAPEQLVMTDPRGRGGALSTTHACAARRRASSSTGLTTAPSIASRRPPTRSRSSTANTASRARFI